MVTTRTTRTFRRLAARSPRSTSHGRVIARLLLVVFAGTGVAACKDTGKFSAARAAENVAFLADTVAKDVDEVRKGLPAGAQILSERLKKDPALTKDLNNVRD